VEDAAARDELRPDTDEAVPLAVGPGSKPELSDLLQLSELADDGGGAHDQDTPPLLVHSIDAVDLKRYGCAAQCSIELGSLPGTEDDVAIEQREVDREDRRYRSDRDSDPSDARDVQQLDALLVGQNLQAVLFQHCLELWRTR